MPIGLFFSVTSAERKKTIDTNLLYFFLKGPLTKNNAEKIGESTIDNLSGRVTRELISDKLKKLPKAILMPNRDVKSIDVERINTTTATGSSVNGIANQTSILDARLTISTLDGLNRGF